jgi:hypothetical protein
VAKEDGVTLWCCHVQGPDDLWAAPNFETADAWARAINSRHARKKEVRVWAVAAHWPYSATAHADELPIAQEAMANYDKD